MKKLFIFALSLSFQSFAHSGGGGNGGFVYKCQDSVELVDLKEIEYLESTRSKIEIKEDNLPFLSQIKRRIQIIKKYSSEIAKELDLYVQNTIGSMQFRRDIDQGEPDDYGYVPKIEGCKLLNVIQYKDKIFFTKKDLFNSLSEFQKTALVFHEAISQLSLAKDIYYSSIKNSIPARRITALLFSSNLNENSALFSELINYYLKANGKQIEVTADINFCLDKKYIFPLSSTSLLEKKNISRLEFTLTNKRHDAFRKGHQSLRLLSETKIKGRNFSLSEKSCDGYQGESYNFIIKNVKLQGKHHFSLEKNFKKPRKWKELDASLTIKVTNVKTQEALRIHFVRDIKTSNISNYTEEFSVNTPLIFNPGAQVQAIIDSPGYTVPRNFSVINTDAGFNRKNVQYTFYDRSQSSGAVQNLAYKKVDDSEDLKIEVSSSSPLPSIITIKEEKSGIGSHFSFDINNPLRFVISKHDSQEIRKFQLSFQQGAEFANFTITAKEGPSLSQQVKVSLESIKSFPSIYTPPQHLDFYVEK